MRNLAQQLGPRIVTPELTSSIPFPEEEAALDRFVGRKFIFYPVFGQGVDYGFTAPIESVIRGRQGWRLWVNDPDETDEQVLVMAADNRPIDYLSGGRSMWLLALPGSDLGNSGNGDQRTVWGRIEFPELA